MEISDNIIGIQDKCEYIGNEFDDIVINNIINSYSNEATYNLGTENNDQIDALSSGYDFNPDEFLNFLPEIKNMNDSNRITPSPTNSSSTSSSFSDSFLPSDHFKNNVGNHIFDTPPISPENEIVNTPKDNLHCLNVFNAERKEGVNNLRPCSTVKKPPVENIKQAKPIGKLTKVCFKKVNKTGNANDKTKMILLPAKDFTNFVKKCKNDGEEKKFPRIVIKSSDSAKKYFANSIEYPTINKFANLIQSNVNSSQYIPVIENNLSIVPVTYTSQKRIVPILPANMQEQIFCFKDNHKSIINDEQSKRHERMIKNRKSASLSRMKKKMYVCSLENKVKELGKENCNLKTENTVLRNQLQIHKKQCQCAQNQDKSYDFINLDNISIFDKRPIKHSTTLHKILLNSPKIKKNTAVLLGMLFMVTLNFGTFNNFLSASNSYDGTDYSDLNTVDNKRFSNYQFEHIGKRNLLWMNDVVSEENNATKNKYSNLIMRKNISSGAYQPCPLYINQTENVRIAHTLQKWIDHNDYFNLSSSLNKISDIPLNFKKDFLDLDDFYKDSISNIQDTKIRYKPNKNFFFNKNGFQKVKKNQMKKGTRAKFDKTEKNYESGILELKPNGKYSKLFEKINRRDDTFYIVSFNTEHILLPASAYNKSSRPKMSLMLPDGDSILDGKITLMQIDCEVVNTTVVDVKEDLIPQNLRPVNLKFNDNEHKTVTPDIDKNLTENSNQKIKAKAFQNIYMTVLSKPTIGPTRKNNDNDFASEEKRKNSSKSYKPYFINND